MPKFEQQVAKKCHKVKAFSIFLNSWALKIPILDEIRFKMNYCISFCQKVINLPNFLVKVQLVELMMVF